MAMQPRRMERRKDLWWACWNAVIQMQGFASIPFALATESKLTNVSEVQDIIRGLKVGKTPSPNRMPYRALKHLSESVLSLLVKAFYAFLRMHHLGRTPA
jgi:hypothetical protein